MRRVAIGTALLIVIASGCGKGSNQVPVVRVRGTVTLDGKPVTKGLVVFFPKFDAPVARGRIKEDGTYVLSTYGSGDGAAIGEFNVAILAQDEEALLESLPEDFAGNVPEPPPLIPRKYFNQNTSELTATTVPGDTNVIDFNLES